MYGHNVTHNFKHIEQAGVSQGAIYRASKHEMFKPYTNCGIRIYKRIRPQGVRNRILKCQNRAKVLHEIKGTVSRAG